VRYGKGFHVATTRNVFYTSNIINRLVSSLEKRLPNVDFELLLVQGDNSEPSDDLIGTIDGHVDRRVLFDAIDDRGNQDWRGTDETWSDLLVRHGGRGLLR
jgi:hypothetical protein